MRCVSTRRMDDKVVKLYIDMPQWSMAPREDDFLIAIGKKQSNSVYHIYKVTLSKTKKHPRMVRYNLKCFRSDLPTALRRDPEQNIIPIHWYKREKKR